MNDNLRFSLKTTEKVIDFHDAVCYTMHNALRHKTAVDFSTV